MGKKSQLKLIIVTNWFNGGFGILEYKRFENESDEELIYRICSEKDKIGSWQKVGDILNSLLNQEYTESKYRKQFQSFQKMLKANQSKFVDCQAELDEIKRQQRELEQSKIQFRDERNAWNKQNYLAARTKQKLDYLEDKLSEISQIQFPDCETSYVNSDNDMMICLSDLHIGSTFDNPFGEYNSDRAKENLSKYLREILKIQTRHQTENAYVCGDIINGSIHRSIHVTNRENVIDQIKFASEYISSFLYELSRHFKTVNVVTVAGNHSRISKKEDALKDERLDCLIGFIMSKMLANQKNIQILDSCQLDTTVSFVEIRGNTYFVVHGDYDTPSESGLLRLCSMIGMFPKGLVMGHRHSPAYSEINGIKIIQSGCLCGSGDDYTIQKRLFGKPSQTVCVCDNKGVQCMYPIEL